MVQKKKIKTKGKLKLSRYFQELKKGEKVSVKRESSVKSSFPLKIQGRTGVVEGKKGGVYIIKMKDQNKEKTFLIPPIHLKKIKPN
ncbi:MAG: 50S ribosomal protein L21e [Nanoarchaeota archaeon]|nr:50S ribosomal protein L21e [Nanoarchaeota archaeon]MBU1028020.1 50S ribosomal protein L21e [Nanoarchaeota archaeon]